MWAVDGSFVRCWIRAGKRIAVRKDELMAEAELES
jgi:hypothetical protein